MDAEISALEQNRTWKVMDLPSGVIPIGNKWIYKIKRKSDGSIERYKARLVAKGYNQVEGLDYFDTFSPVAKITTIRALLALASVQGWHLHQMDVNNAFLHGDLHEDVYMTLPLGFPSQGPNKVCKLIKSLYGLKQASRHWFEKLHTVLLENGYAQAAADHTLFVKRSNSSYTALLVYVDDVILAGNSISEFSIIKRILDDKFRIKDLGQLKYFLGLEVARSSRGIALCQCKYCLDLLHEAGVLGSKPASTHIDCALRISQEGGVPYDDIPAYRRLIGHLLYLTTTRPDIAFSVQQLSQFMACPSSLHYKAACRILRYLKGCPGRGLFFPSNSSLQLFGFSDADWGGCIDTRRSVSSYCFYLGESLISWRSKKQTTVSRSLAEAEYRALAAATTELQWIVYLLHDLGITCTKTPVLYCDNQSALHIAPNPVFHERTKHLDIDCHLVREKMQSGLMRLLLVASTAQCAIYSLRLFLLKPLFIFFPSLAF